MAITHTWKIRSLFQVNDGTGTIARINYYVDSYDGDFFARSGGDIVLDIENIENFIPYDQLDEQTAIGWVKEKIGDKVSELESANESCIEGKKNPPAPEFISQPFPWNQPQPVVEEPTPAPVEEETQIEEPVVE